MTHSYHPNARKELDDAADYYDSIDLGLGDNSWKRSMTSFLGFSWFRWLGRKLSMGR